MGLVIGDAGGLAWLVGPPEVVVEDGKWDKKRCWCCDWGFRPESHRNDVIRVRVGHQPTSNLGFVHMGQRAECKMLGQICMVVVLPRPPAPVDDRIEDFGHSVDGSSRPI